MVNMFYEKKLRKGARGCGKQPGKASLPRMHVSQRLREVSEDMGIWEISTHQQSLLEEHSRQKQQPVQRSCGRCVPGTVKDQNGGQCDWVQDGTKEEVVAEELEKVADG